MSKKDKLNKFLSRHDQTSIFLWLIVGGYLVYLAYQILTGDMGTANDALLYVFCALFIIAGGLIVAVSLYALIGKHYKMPPPLAAEDEDEETEGEE